MVVDIGEVKRHIKPKADSTLFNMRKSDLIEYVRTLEHNYNVGATFLENQAKYIESLDMVEVVRCKDCKNKREYVPTRWFCGLTGMPIDEDDFCSCGERKANG